MEIINGKEYISNAYLFECNSKEKVTTYTDDHTVTWNQAGQTLVMNSSSNKTFTLPAAAEAYVGTKFTFININTGRLTLAASGAGVKIGGEATLYSDDDSVATCEIELASATAWVVNGGTGTWTATT